MMPEVMEIMNISLPIQQFLLKGYSTLGTLHMYYFSLRGDYEIIES